MKRNKGLYTKGIHDIESVIVEKETLKDILPR